MSIVGCIFARGGSRRVINKNLRDCAGKSLLEWAIEVAKNVELIDEIYVSTDSVDIAAEAERLGAKVPFLRPAKLASDEADELHAWQHMIDYLRKDQQIDFDTFISLPPTAPCRTPEDVKRCLKKFEEYRPDIAVTVTEARRHPQYNLVRGNSNLSDLRLWDTIRSGRKDGGKFGRQDIDCAYDLTTVAYVANPSYVMNCSNLLEGRVVGVLVTPENGVDIDTELDLALADNILSKRTNMNA